MAQTTVEKAQGKFYFSSSMTSVGNSIVLSQPTNTLILSVTGASITLGFDDENKTMTFPVGVHVLTNFTVKEVFLTSLGAGAFTAFAVCGL